MGAPLFLGFDLGGTQVRAALIENGTVLRKEALRTDVKGGPEAVMRQFQQLFSIVAAGLENTIVGLGIASPGPLDTASGIVIHITTLPNWENFPLLRRMKEQFNLPLVLENDGVAAAYGEWKHGAGQGVNNLVYATVSTGLGGGVVVDGRLLHGRRGMASHIGHISIAREGPVCTCGRVGCFEAFAAGTALGNRASEIAKSSQGWLAHVAKSEAVDARHVVEGARQRDPECLALLNEEARLLGSGFASLLHLYSPDVIVMGGGVSNAFDLLEEEIHATIQREAMAPFRDVRVVPATLGDNAGLVGVATLAADAMTTDQLSSNSLRV
jgi:glucokinase